MFAKQVELKTENCIDKREQYTWNNTNDLSIFTRLHMCVWMCSWVVLYIYKSHYGFTVSYIYPKAITKIQY